MAEEIEKFDPSKLMQGVKDRIKATFVSLIPDDQWDAMVKKEVDAFFNEEVLVKYSTERKNHSYYSDAGKEYINKEVKQSPFRQLVWELCYTKANELMKDRLKVDFFGDQWPITPENMKESLVDVVKAAAPVAMQRFFEGIAMGYMNQLREDIRNGYVR